MMDGFSYVFHSRNTDNSVCHRISQFACDETMKSRLSFLDQELSVFGYPSIQTASNSLNGVTLINIVHDLLQIYRKSLQRQSDANDNCRNSESEVLRFKQLFLNTKEELATKMSELKSKNLVESQLNEKIERLKTKVKTEQDRTRKMNHDFASRDCQYKHEKKKLQQELDRLLEKLNKLLQDKRKESFNGFEILNSLKRQDGSRGKWNTDKSKKSNENDMYRIIISNYEEAQSVIIKENEDMRNYLRRMQREISESIKENRCSLSNGKKRSTSSNSCSEDSYSSDEVENDDTTASEELFSMPYHMVKDDIELLLNNKWHALKKLIKNNRRKSSQDSKPSPPPSSGNQIKIEELEKVIHKQQKIINILKAESESNRKKHEKESNEEMKIIMKEKADLEKERALIENKKRNLDQDRRDYTNSLGKLHEDRLKFENERCAWLKKHYFQNSPFQELIDGKLSSAQKNNSSNNKMENSSMHRHSHIQTTQSTSPSTSVASSSSSVSNCSDNGFVINSNNLHNNEQLHNNHQSLYTTTTRNRCGGGVPIPTAGRTTVNRNNSTDDDTSDCDDDISFSLPHKYSRPSRRFSISDEADDQT